MFAGFIRDRASERDLDFRCSSSQAKAGKSAPSQRGEGHDVKPLEAFRDAWVGLHVLGTWLAQVERGLPADGHDGRSHEGKHTVHVVPLLVAAFEAKI